MPLIKAQRDVFRVLPSQSRHGVSGFHCSLDVDKQNPSDTLIVQFT
jgi:hypothetical protein